VPVASTCQCLDGGAWTKLPAKSTTYSVTLVKQIIGGGSPPASAEVQFLTVGEESAGQRLDNFLIRVLKGVPKTHVYRIIRSGEVRVNKGRASADARVAIGDVVWPLDAGGNPQLVASLGIQHHYARLALVQKVGASLTVTPCAKKFPPLTAIAASDVSFDDTICQSGSKTVQQAIDHLCQQDRSCCEITVSPDGRWVAFQESDNVWIAPFPLAGVGGTTVRIDRLKAGDGYAIYFHCQSGLVAQFRQLYPETFTYEGQRAMHFAAKDRLPVRELRHCIALALTHHLRKKGKRGG